MVPTMMICRFVRNIIKQIAFDKLDMFLSENSFNTTIDVHHFQFHSAALYQRKIVAYQIQLTIVQFHASLL